MYVSSEKVPESFYTDILKDELNVKEIDFTEDVSGYTTYLFKPQLRTVGPKYGKFLGQIQKALSEIDGNQAYAALKKEGVLKLPEIDETIALLPEDLLIESVHTEGYESAGDDYVTVVLDKTLTPELIREGFMRELVSKIQTQRKEAGFEVMDRIRLSYMAPDTIEEVFHEFEEEIEKDVLAVSIQKGSLQGFQKEWNINGKMVILAVEKVKE